MDDDHHPKVKEEREKQRREEVKQKEKEDGSRMKPLTYEAYGGGMYGRDEGETEIAAKPKANKPLARETQSADGPDEATTGPSQASTPTFHR
ncbi:hypothetical protein PRUPE_1G355200 [Prunus persica]|uniref:Uncharacterized protein n=1 Tax=Prunus persica TaxID=3760 RepID=M5XC13_PRUPE|nr:hypothetical protein PRUPE_1G355200 [Prunus persica]